MPDLIQQLEAVSDVATSSGPDPSVIRQRARRRQRRRRLAAGTPLALLAVVLAIRPWRTDNTSVVSADVPSTTIPAVSITPPTTPDGLYDRPQPVPEEERSDWDRVASVLGPDLTAGVPVHFIPQGGHEIVEISGAPFKVSLVLQRLEQPHLPTGEVAGMHRYPNGGESVLLGIGASAARVHYTSPSGAEVLVINLGTTLAAAEQQFGDLVALMPRLYEATGSSDG